MLNIKVICCVFGSRTPEKSRAPTLRWGKLGDMEEAGSVGFYGDVDKTVLYGFTAAPCHG
jgi:hypothetical protein